MSHDSLRCIHKYLGYNAEILVFLLLPITMINENLTNEWKPFDKLIWCFGAAVSFFF